MEQIQSFFRKNISAKAIDAWEILLTIHHWTWVELNFNATWIHEPGHPPNAHVATCSNEASLKQGSPPCCGGGLSHALVLLTVPFPQEALHDVHGVHSPQFPSTVTKRLQFFKMEFATKWFIIRIRLLSGIRHSLHRKQKHPNCALRLSHIYWPINRFNNSSFKNYIIPINSWNFALRPSHARSGTRKLWMHEGCTDLWKVCLIQSA